MNLSGILVVCAPGYLDRVAQRLADLPGVEVHHVEAETGRIVAVQEADAVEAEVDGLRRIKALPGVVLAEMVYHCFEDATAGATTPDSADTQPNDAGVAPANLREDRP